MDNTRSKIPSVPRIGVPPQLQQFLQAIRSHINAISPPNQPPASATNLTVTPSALGNIIHFTGGENATSHVLLVSKQSTWDPSRQGSSVIDLGVGNEYYHHIGQSGQQVYYSVVAYRSGASAPPTTPVGGVTLASNVAAATPPYVPPGKLANSTITGKPIIIKGGRYVFDP